MKSINDVNSGHTVTLKQNFYWYKGATASAEGKQASGAYIFRPNGTQPFEVATGPVKTERIDVSNALTFLDAPHLYDVSF